MGGVGGRGHLGQLTHLPQVVVSLLQPGELSQETLVLPPLLVQLCPQSGAPLGHLLLQTLCIGTHTHTHTHSETQSAKVLHLLVIAVPRYTVLGFLLLQQAGAQLVSLATQTLLLLPLRPRALETQRRQNGNDQTWPFTPLVLQLKKKCHETKQFEIQLVQLNSFESLCAALELLTLKCYLNSQKVPFGEPLCCAAHMET